MSKAREILDAAMTEADLQREVIARAQELGYLVYHQRPARTADGWRTALTGTRGFPDLVLARDHAPEVGWTGRVLFVELKGQRGQLSEWQEYWIGVLRAAGAEVHVWRPQDWSSGAIEEVLR